MHVADGEVEEAARLFLAAGIAWIVPVLGEDLEVFDLPDGFGLRDEARAGSEGEGELLLAASFRRGGEGEGFRDWGSGLAIHQDLVSVFGKGGEPGELDATGEVVFEARLYGAKCLISEKDGDFGWFGGAKPNTR